MAEMIESATVHPISALASSNPVALHSYSSHSYLYLGFPLLVIRTWPTATTGLSTLL